MILCANGCRSFASQNHDCTKFYLVERVYDCVTVLFV